jgi:transcription elongation GreA/GreB family factor
VGAGAELTGPGGDGFLSVVTPGSPVGKALIGKRAGQQAEVMLKKGVCELHVLEVA